MAMNATTLGNLMATALGVTDAAAKAAMVSVAGAIISHVQSAAQVTTVDTINALGLIAPGGLSPAPVTGVATGSGTGTIA